jgi:hypothetical protein
MLNNCIVDFEINGKKRGFKFGTLAVRMIMELRGLNSINDLIIRMSNAADIPFTLDILYCAAKSWCMAKKVEIDFTQEDVADWMDEIGLDEATSIINKAFTQYSPPTKQSKKKTLKNKILQFLSAFWIGKRSQSLS